MSSSSVLPPSASLYVTNIPSKIKKPELRLQLYTLFSTYGKVIDVVATRAEGMRGQAFIVFETLQASTSAMRGLSGFLFYQKPLRITYAKTKSKAILRKELGSQTVLEMDLENANNPIRGNNNVTISSSRKRSVLDNQDQETDSEGSDAKQQTSHDDEEEDETTAEPKPKRTKLEPESDSQKEVKAEESTTIICRDLPPEMEQEMLSILFQQYQGFQDVSPPKPTTTTTNNNSNDTSSTPTLTLLTANARFDTSKNAAQALAGLNGFRLSATHTLQLELP